MLFEKIELEDGEELTKVVRKHWFIITMELIGIGFLAILPLFVLFGFAFIPENDILPDGLTPYSLLISFSLLLWFVITIMMAAMAWTHYYLDLWIITDRRIIVVEQLGFFNRKVSSFRIERLQDIKVSVNGIIATFLNFGTIRAQTASAAESNFKNTGLPDPRGLQSLIQSAMDKRLHSLQGGGPHQQEF